MVLARSARVLSAGLLDQLHSYLQIRLTVGQVRHVSSSFSETPRACTQAARLMFVHKRSVVYGLSGRCKRVQRLRELALAFRRARGLAAVAAALAAERRELARRALWGGRIPAPAGTRPREVATFRAREFWEGGTLDPRTRKILILQRK